MRTTIGGDIPPGSPCVFCEARAEFAVAARDQVQTGTASTRRDRVEMSKYAEGGAAWLTRKREYGASPARDIRKSPACVMAAKRKRNDL